MKISRPVLINTSLGVVIAAAVVGALAFTLPNSASAGDDDTTQLTSTVQQGVVSSSISATGQIAAAHEASASFAVSGTVATVDVALGATVAAGQQLATLDTTDLADAVADAERQLKSAKADRTAAQTSVNNANEQELSNAQSQLRQAQTSVDNAADTLADAKADLASATLTSPIAGLVIAIGAVGDSAGSAVGGTESTGFATIADVTAMSMTADIAEADIADVTVGQVATVTFPALADVEATATVTAIPPTATASNSVVTYATTITLDAIPEGLRLGQTAEVAITIEASADDALYVPSAAITTTGDTSTVDVVEEDGTVTTTTVTLGVVGDQGTEILTGLTLGQTIVLGEVSTTEDEDTGFTQGNFGGGQLPEGFTPPEGVEIPSGGFPG